MPLRGFQPAVARWFRETLGEPTSAQTLAWPKIRAGEDVLVAAPTGSGKTLAAFLFALDDLFRRGREGTLAEAVQVLYVSPLRALGNDIAKNLEAPLEGIARALLDEGVTPPVVRAAVRTGDTPASERAKAAKKPPHIYVTTPESLYLLLTSESGRAMLREVRTVIVDEIHAILDDKRGAHLSLSLERLEALVGRRVQRIGLSATQRPIDEVARFLVGSRRIATDGRPECAIVDVGHLRTLDLGIELPPSPLETVMSNEVWEELSDRVAALVREHRTTIVFVNSRRSAERTARRLADRLGDDVVGSHHGSLSREIRHAAEQKLKTGALRVIVATASLELGIDVGDVDLVVQVGSTGGIATFLQRAGRAGHGVGRVPKARTFPLTRDELVEAIALFDAIGKGSLERITVPRGPLDILAQQIVADVAMEEVSVEVLFDRVRGAYPYRALSRESFDATLAMLADGFATDRGRRAALLHLDAVHGIVRPRRAARITALMGGGAIPDTFDYDVRLEPEGLRIGTLNEDFAIESMAGDIFQLGNASYQIRKVEPGVIRVADAKGQPPTIPFWIAEVPGRSAELSESVAALRAHVATCVPGRADDAVRDLASIPGVGELAAREAAAYLEAGFVALGVMPTTRTIVLERFFDEAGSMHLVFHAPFGTRTNRALGLALRKRFCRSFNVELQAAAADDAFVLSLGPMHSMPLDEVYGYLRSSTARDVLVQALLDAPMFGTRFRWNATRALAVPRRRAGKPMPPRIVRVLSDDLLAVCFPDQVACAENLDGPRTIPDHPLVTQTIDDCLEEAMDVEGMLVVLRGLEDGSIAGVVRDTTEPSPFAHAILNPRPYAFLDDAPLEERRTMAIRMRRSLDTDAVRELGALDADAIARVREECAPTPRDAEELHDQLLSNGALPTRELGDGARFFERLVATDRAVRGSVDLDGVTTELAVARERLHVALAAWPMVRLSPTHAPLGTVPPRDEAIRELVRGRLDRMGPQTASDLGRALAFGRADVDAALAALEGAGIVLRGSYSPGVSELEWCERGLLARIHRYTLDRLRRAIEPVEPAHYLRFLLRYQSLGADDRRRGVEGLASVLERLEGFDAPALAWEQDLLPARVESYDPALLDLLCLTGRVAWFRRVPPSSPRPGASPIKSMPVSIAERFAIDAFRVGSTGTDSLSPEAESVLAVLQRDGAAFVHDLVRRAGVLPSRVEDALAELAHRGLAISDSFAGLRAFLAPPRRPRPGREHTKHAITSAGRWSSLPDAATTDVERVAMALLRRYGVVFRRILDREDALPTWRELLRVYRSLEARGTIRGGRFVAGFSGEQYALPEVIPALRAARTAPKTDELVSVTAADPVNLLGLVTPDARVAAIASNRILFRDGTPIAVLESGKVRHLANGSVPPSHAEELSLARHAGSRRVNAIAGPHTLARR